MMTYQDAERHYIESYKHGSKQPAETFAAALAALGEPHLAVPVIHVAGTNGKGSVCAMLDSILRAAGHSVGLYTSPHLTRVTERFRLNGAEMGKDGFARYTEAVMAVERKLNARFSYFQLLTLMCFAYFRDNAPDFAVIETGIGGRLDCTNAVAPILSVITPIGLDHTDILGGTVAEIAAEKAGIIKRGAPAAVSRQRPQAMAVIERAARDMGAEVYQAEPYTLAEDTLEGLRGDFGCYAGLRVNLAGTHQAGNAATALAAVRALRARGVNIPDAAVYQGMDIVRWPGRLEVISRNPLFILDGAHNVDGAAALNTAVGRYLSGQIVAVVVGILKTKDWREMLGLLTARARFAAFTQPAYAAKAVPPEELAAAAGLRPHVPVLVEEDFKRAVDSARMWVGGNGAVVCAGSLYLAGDVRDYISGDEHDKL